MDDIIIRKATTDDLPSLLEFEQGIIKFERPYDPTLEEDPISYYDLGALIKSENAEVLVAEHNEKIVASGYAKIKRARHYLDHENYSYLGFMFTRPEFRGKGINKKIIEVLRGWSLSRGLKEIRLTVYDDNVGAIKAYEKTGFKKHLIEMRLIE
ncbi:MAG: GNAT family N-acetyltransferase [Aurantibacter sp.]